MNRVTLSPLRVIIFYFLLSISPLNHTFRSWEERKQSSTVKKVLIVKQILLVITKGNVKRTIMENIVNSENFQQNLLSSHLRSINEQKLQGL